MNIFLDELRLLLDTAGVLSGKDTAAYCLDQRRRYQGAALAVARPRNTAEVAAVIKLCAQHGVAIVPQGGNTSLCGAATPDASGKALVLSTERMNRVLKVDSDNNTIIVEAGAILADVQAAARAANRLFPADWAAAGSCRMGGALATNAGGVNVLRYGNMRELTLGLEVVLPNGEVLDGLRGLRKDNTGYDLKQLFIGSEGTLGVITRAVLRLYPLPTAHATALVGLDHPAAAVELLRGIQAAVGDRVTSFELISKPCFELLAKQCPSLPHPFKPLPEWAVLLELSDGGSSEVLSDQLAGVLVSLGCENALLAQNSKQARDFWQLREHIPEAQRREGVSIKHDISVPVGSIPDFLTECGQELVAVLSDAAIIAFGHLGDGNLHYNVFRSDKTAAIYSDEPMVNDIVYACVAKHNGSISAEHGIGQLKRQHLAKYRNPLELALMKSIKQSFDSAGIMNPGKVLLD
ncbi:FAD-binding oxidoreductase [Iodobacter sp.]|uniref:FAD-binding oxidoreductase n=1 Tax=Iodobacter sp. TaxID=1915058 RepID=UPI0025F6C209|nr:FAD-binding oxidoreductase [Iodobacter sp.]